MDREVVRAGVTVGLVEMILHWAPWPKCLGDEMQPPTTYVVGMAPILGSFSIWAIRRRRLTGQEAAIGAWVITALAGAAVALAYGVDKLFGLRAGAVARRARPSAHASGTALS